MLVSRLRTELLIAALAIPLAVVCGADHKHDGTQAGRDCPVTIPNDFVPPGEEAAPGFHGEGGLFALLPETGVLIAVPPGYPGDGWVTSDVRPGGAVGVKLGWWRGEGVSGPLRLSGRRLQGPTALLRTEVADYGPTGFQASSVVFPSAGCWEITARAGGHVLTVVLRFVDRVTDRSGRVPRAPRRCDVTRPNGRVPSRVPVPLNHGNHRIGTMLPPDGVIVAEAPGSRLTPASITGAIRRGRRGVELRSWPWTRRAAHGAFRIRGRRVGGPARTLRARAPDDTTTDFTTRIVFPRAGCWRITARDDRTRISFVVYLADRLG